MNRYVQSDIAESERILKFVAGEYHHSPAFLDRLVPSAIFSITYLATEYKIVKVSEQTQPSTDKRYYASLVCCQRGNRRHFGAASSKHPVVAKYLAWAKGIRQLMLTEELLLEAANYS